MTERLHAHLHRLQPLLARVNDCKRIRTAASAPRSFASRRFARAWADLAAGTSVAEVALRETAAALVACELAGVEARALRVGGFDDAAIVEVFERAVRRAGEVLAAPWCARLVGAVPLLLDTDLVEADIAAKAATHIATHVAANTVADTAANIATGNMTDSTANIAVSTATDTTADTTARVPAFVPPLQAQPRAGATHPSERRLILEPAESHADHAWAVAVSAALVAGDVGADIGAPFLAGLSHHLHNAVLPDAGFAGEALLGERIEPLVARLQEAALATLPAALAAEVRASLALLPTVATTEAMAFHAADVIDRVLEVVQFDRVARFRKEHALETLGLVHPGPLKSFQDGVLAATGLVPR